MQQQIVKQPLVMPIKEAASLLGMHPDSLRNAIKSGEIEGQKICGQFKLNRKYVYSLAGEPEPKPIVKRRGRVKKEPALSQ